MSPLGFGSDDYEFEAREELKKQQRSSNMKEKTRTILEYTLGAPALLWAGLSLIIVIAVLAVLSIPLMILEYILEKNS